jgi:hypothetical protein
MQQTVFLKLLIEIFIVSQYLIYTQLLLHQNDAQNHSSQHYKHVVTLLNDSNLTIMGDEMDVPLYSANAPK